MSERVICDCDNTTGVPEKPIDDGQTLLYLSGRPDLELLGITTTFGNGTIDEVHGATVSLLRELGRDDVPLHRGAGRRGERRTEAAHFLAETAARYQGEINLLAIGPVGNLAAAAELDPRFFYNLKQITCMGGYLRSLDMEGWHQVAELNLSRDPEAAYLALHAPCPFTLMNAQVCLDAPFGLDELERIQAWKGSTVYRWLNDYLVSCGRRHAAPRDYLWDLLPAVYISHPELFGANPVSVCSTLADLETGTILVGDGPDAARINMPASIADVDRFYQIAYAAWERAPVRPVSAGGRGTA